VKKNGNIKKNKNADSRSGRTKISGLVSV